MTSPEREPRLNWEPMRSLFRLIRGAGLLAMVSIGVSMAGAEQALRLGRLTNYSRILAAFEPATQAVRLSVVRVLMEDKPVALGLIVSADGLVITKASEIDSIRRISIQRGQETLLARPVGWSEANDIVVLKVSATDWPLPAWNDGSDPAVGSLLVTPGAENLPLVVGVVSVARRAIEKDETRGVLGIQMPQSSEQAIIEDMFDGSAAKAAGLQIGDLIVKAGAVVIDTRLDLIREIASHQPGETVILEIRRGSETLTIPATLTHPFGQFLSRIAQQNRLGGEVSRRASGFPAAIQHDSVLSPGQCGGPVVNVDSQIVGINIARSGRTESLLIPTSVVKEVLQAHRDGQLPALPPRSPAVPPPPSPAIPLD